MMNEDLPYEQQMMPILKNYDKLVEENRELKSEIKALEKAVLSRYLFLLFTFLFLGTAAANIMPKSACHASLCFPVANIGSFFDIRFILCINLFRFNNSN